MVVTPPAEEPVSADLVRKHARIDADGDDDLVAVYVAAARQAAETFLSRALITQVLQWRVWDGEAEGAHRVSLPGTGWFPSVVPFSGVVRAKALLLPRSPVQAVLEVACGDPEGGPDQVLDTSAWMVDGAGEPARLRLHQSDPFRTSRHVSVTFRAGYGDAPSSVPAPIILGILMTAAWLWENRGDVEAEQPLAAERLWWPYRLVGFGG